MTRKDKEPDAATATFHLAGQLIVAPALAPGLYVVATPIGNLGDITIRALETLAGADVIACEDTRVTRRLLERYGIATDLIAYHDRNGARVRPVILSRLARGERVAIVSDAGTPLVSDPGYKLVREARAQGYDVVALPGASSPLAALVASALPTDRFLFAGFLPNRAARRRSTLETLASVEATLVFFESPRRLAASLGDMAAILGPREAVVARELTKFYEEKVYMPLDQLAAHYGNAPAPKGEIVVLVGPPQAGANETGDAETLLREALETLSVRDAASQVAKRLNRPRRDIYALAVALNRDRTDEPSTDD